MTRSRVRLAASSLTAAMDSRRVPETDLRRAPQIGADLLELIARLQDSLEEAWREIHALRDKITSLSPATELLTVENLVERHPALTTGGIRWMLFHREANGLARSGAIIRRGRRIYLDEARFLDWFASQKARSGAVRGGRGGA